MSAESAPGGVGSVFRGHLNSAITDGVRPSRESGLGVDTFNAIDLVATNHPEADARQITDAYDAFAREHGVIAHPIDDVEQDSRPGRPQKHTVARKNRFRVR